MIFIGFLFSLLFSIALGEGEFLVVHSPPSVKFQGDEPIDQHLISDILSAGLGFTTQADSDWPGFKITDPFNFAEAVVVLNVEGISSLGRHKDIKSYFLNTNEDESLTWKIVKNRIIDRFPTENNTLLRLELGYEVYDLDDEDVKGFDPDVEEEAVFLQELKDLDNVIQKSEKGDGVPDCYWFILKGLHAISDLRGPHHPVTLKAKEKVIESLLKLGKAFSSIYHGRVLVVGIVSDSSHTRRTRSIVERDTNTSNPADVNLATKYSQDYPAIFNIILWFTVAFILSLIAISVFIASMDPGRDSIIYRMTSNRMKKDS